MLIWSPWLITSSSCKPHLDRRRVLFGVALAGLGIWGSAWAQPLHSQAVSRDGLWRLVAEPQGRVLVLHDAQGTPVRRYPWPEPRPGVSASGVLTPVVVQDHPLRRSFVAAFGGAAVLWEISYNPQADVIYDGLVHDYRLKEGLPRPGFLGVRRTPLEQPLDDFWIDPGSPHVLGRVLSGQADAGADVDVRKGVGVGRDSSVDVGEQGRDSVQVQVINLDIRRQRASFNMPSGYRLAGAQVVGPPSQRVLLLQAPLTPQGAPSAPPVCVSLTAWQVMPCVEKLQIK